jgi:hypothetical protein
MTSTINMTTGPRTRRANRTRTGTGTVRWRTAIRTIPIFTTDTVTGDRTQPGGDKLTGYSLAFLTDEWEWEADLAADTFEQAKTAARTALEDLVRDEAPELACVTLLKANSKLGVWDWVEKRAYWTPL